MELISNISQFYLLSLSLGLSLFSLLVNTKMTGVGFYKVLLGVIGGSMVISFTLCLLDQANIEVIFFYVLCFVVISLLFTKHADERSYFMWGLYGIKVSLIGLISYFIINNNETFYYFLSSMALLGCVTFTMLLGHWYLVTPKLTERPLAIGLMIMWFVLLVKIGITIFGYFESQDFFESGTLLGMGYSFNWLMLLMRVGWGYLIISIMSFFTWKLVKMRSLQSATGILYVMTFFVFMGELISSYLYYNYGLLI